MTFCARAHASPTRPFLVAGVFACAMLSACADTPRDATAGVPAADADMAIQPQVADPRHDMVFLTRAMQSDMLEISASQLALQQASDPR